MGLVSYWGKSAGWRSILVLDLGQVGDISANGNDRTDDGESYTQELKEEIQDELRM